MNCVSRPGLRQMDTTALEITNNTKSHVQVDGVALHAAWTSAYQCDSGFRLNSSVEILVGKKCPSWWFLSKFTTEMVAKQLLNDC